MKRIINGIFLVLAAGLIVPITMVIELDTISEVAVIAFSYPGFVAVLYAWVFSGKYYSEDIRVFKSYYEINISWIKLNNVWVAVYYWFFCVSILAPIFVLLQVAYNEEVPPFVLVLYSLVGLSATVLNFTINPKKYAYGYRSAFNGLDEALYLAPHLDRGSAENVLLEAMKNGERYITHAMYDTFDVCNKISTEKDDKKVEHQD